MSESNQVKKIYVVSNTHWDREFRFSFEKTRYKLLKMLDTVIDILDHDPNYHSFTLDGHTLLVADYLEMRPQKIEKVKKYVREGRLVIGPYFTLAEEFSIQSEALVRNLLFGRKLMNSFGAPEGKVAYTPSSWGQTGQYPQILSDFGLEYMMFYRGISHDEAPAEYVWEAPDGSSVLASRFALYCRYNWFYQVHRAVTRHKVFDKTYKFGEYDEAMYRRADIERDEGIGYDLKSPVATYDRSELKKAVEDMLKEEEGHFTTPIFLAMNGHDISSAYPLESQIIKDAQEIFKGKYEIIHTDLEHFWHDAEEYLDRDKMVHLVGERRSYLKKGKWTYLMPSTISARSNMKQIDCAAYNNLVYSAEPMSFLAKTLNCKLDHNIYMEKAWNNLLSNHTHDANGGGAVDAVCKDMRYRARKVNDISDIIVEDSTAAITANFSFDKDDNNTLRLTAFNMLPFERNIISDVELMIPAEFNDIALEEGTIQIIETKEDSTFVDSIWEVPTIMDVKRVKAIIEIPDVPAMGYKSVKILNETSKTDKRRRIIDPVIENEYLIMKVNSNGTVNVTDKVSGKKYSQLNYFTSEGEIGNAWNHRSPKKNMVFNTLDFPAEINIDFSGELCGKISVKSNFFLPKDCEKEQNFEMIAVPISVSYELRKGERGIRIETVIDNTVKDHWLRANFGTGIETDYSYSDSHFDIVKRDIKVPNSKGWVEKAYGMQPLRTFAAVCDKKNGFAVMPKGLYEYEVLEDGKNTLALTLIRACRIKLQVSEEKLTELPDDEIQLPGKHRYEYMIKFFDSDELYELPNFAARYFAKTPVIVSGKGKGSLPLRYSAFSLDNNKIHISAVKRSEDNTGTVIRMFNPTDSVQKVNLLLNFKYDKIYRCRCDETIIEEINTGFEIPHKKIYSLLIK